MGMNREILRLSLPAIVSNITVPLLGLCDTAIAGHLGAPQLAAMVIGASMLNMVFWLFGFLRMGTTGLTAQAFGAGDERAVRDVFTRAMAIAVTAGILILALSRPLASLLIRLLADGGAPAQLARGYYLIVIFGAPALLATNTINGFLLGLQNTFLPMVISISVNLLNIGLSLAFVYLFGLGFTGIALGTLSADWLGFLLALAVAVRFRRGKGLWSPLADAVRGGGLGRFFRVNSDIFFRSACVMAVSLTVTAVGARLGDTILAANGVMMQFFTFFSYFMDGFAFTGEALCGRFAGARDSVSLRHAVRLSLKWAACIAILFTAVYTLFWRQMTGLITDIPAVGETVGEYYVWLCLIPVVTVAAFIFDGFYIGLTATRRMLAVTFAAAMVFFLVSFVHPWMRPAVGIGDNNTLWLAFLLYLLTRGASLAVMTPKLLKQYD